MTFSSDPTPARAGGWRVFALLAAALLAMVAAVLAADPGVDGVRLSIRLTAWTSLLLFLATFTASAAARRWPGRLTRWTLRRRRPLGLAFALSHAIHLAAIVAFARLAPAAYAEAARMTSLAAGGLAYAFIAAMAATSSDAAVAWLGARAWRRLHWLGAWYLWISFAVAFGKRVPQSPLYAAPLALLVLALALRVWPRAGAVAGARGASLS